MFARSSRTAPNGALGHVAGSDGVVRHTDLHRRRPRVYECGLDRYGLITDQPVSLPGSRAVADSDSSSAHGAGCIVAGGLVAYHRPSCPTTTVSDRRIGSRGWAPAAPVSSGGGWGGCSPR